MKEQIIFFRLLRVVIVLLCVAVIQSVGFTQNSEAKAQPVKKSSTAPVTNTNKGAVAPWEKQRIQPVNNKQATTNTKAHHRPDQPQPLPQK